MVPAGEGSLLQHLWEAPPARLGRLQGQFPKWTVGGVQEGGSEASSPASVSPLVNGSGGSCDGQCLGCRQRSHPTLNGRPRGLQLPTPPTLSSESGRGAAGAGGQVQSPTHPTVQLRTLPSPWSACGVRSGPEVSGRPFPQAPAKEEGSFLPPPPAAPPPHLGQGQVLSSCQRGLVRWGPCQHPQSLTTGLSSHSATCHGDSPAAAAPSGPHCHAAPSRLAEEASHHQAAPV